MRKQSLQFLSNLMAVPSPSGFEQPAQQVVREYVADFADEVRTDVHGNVIAAKNPDGFPRVMLAGHCDQIGFMVQYINDNGFINFASIGGVDVAVVPGTRVLIHTKDGPLVGVIGRKPIHLLTPEERTKPKLELKKMWIDIGAKDKKAAEKIVQPGDPITFELGLHHLQGDLVTGAGFDDKVGVFVVMETLRLLADKKIECALFSVATVQEELGLRGAKTSAFGIDPQVGIAVDVTFASDHPEADKTLAGEIKLGSGPVIARGPNINPPLHELIVAAAEAEKIPWQPEPAPRGTGTDANAMQITRAGVAAALVSIPDRYMHTPVEIVSLKDLENAARLLAATIASIKPDTDFIPR